jgi:hypothetical protein
VLDGGVGCSGQAERWTTGGSSPCPGRWPTTASSARPVAAMPRCSSRHSVRRTPTAATSTCSKRSSRWPDRRWRCAPRSRTRSCTSSRWPTTKSLNYSTLSSEGVFRRGDRVELLAHDDLGRVGDRTSPTAFPDWLASDQDLRGVEPDDGHGPAGAASERAALGVARVLPTWPTRGVVPVWTAPKPMRLAFRLRGTSAPCGIRSRRDVTFGWRPRGAWRRSWGHGRAPRPPGRSGTQQPTWPPTCALPPARAPRSP